MSKEHSALWQKGMGPWRPQATIQSLPGGPPISPFTGPSTQKLQQTPAHPSKSGSGNPGREEVELASNRGCKAASHAHCTGWHQEIKLPRHGLQQRSTASKAGRTDGQYVSQGGGGVRNRRRAGQHRTDTVRVGTRVTPGRPGSGHHRGHRSGRARH